MPSSRQTARAGGCCGALLVDWNYMRNLLALLVALLLAACSNPPYPRGSLEQLYPVGPRPIQRLVQTQGRTIQITEMAGTGSRPVVFVHGSPGSWSAWARYLDAPALAGMGTRIAVDRPGFGGSAAGGVVPGLRQQADMLAAAIPSGVPAILVGHSLGGPLIAWMAIDHPEKVCGIVMVAGSLAPDLEAPRWYNQIAATWLASAVVPQSLQLSNTEMMALRPELQLLDRHWSRLQRPTIAMQGGKDSLVDPATTDYLAQRMGTQWLRIVRDDNADHFQLWTQPQAVIRQILDLPCP